MISAINNKFMLKTANEEICYLRLEDIKMKQDIEIIIEKENWRFAFTYIDTHPHKYIVREKYIAPNNFDIISQYVKDKGHQEFVRILAFLV